MFKKHITLFKYDPNDRDGWLSLRKRMSGEGNPHIFRAGGSDIGKITGTDEWTADIAFFHHACGWERYEVGENLHIYAGRKNEPHIYEDYWKYYDPKYPLNEYMMANERNDNVIRKARRVNAIIWNEKYPNLFGNIDYMIQKRNYDFGQEEGEFPYHKYSGKVGILELKDMKWETMRKYEAGIPRNYVEQHHSYLGISEVSWGEIFVRKDRLEPLLFPYEFDKDIFEYIVDTVNDFARRVIDVKQLIASGAPLDEVMSLIHVHEPVVTGSPAWTKFLDEKHHPDNLKPEIDGPDWVLERIIKYMELKETVDPIHEELNKIENEIKKIFIDKEIMTMKFGDLGQIKWHLKWNFKQAAKSIFDKYKVKML